MSAKMHGTELSGVAVPCDATVLKQKGNNRTIELNHEV